MDSILTELNHGDKSNPVITKQKFYDTYLQLALTLDPHSLSKIPYYFWETIKLKNKRKLKFLGKLKITIFQKVINFLLKIGGRVGVKTTLRKHIKIESSNSTMFLPQNRTFYKLSTTFGTTYRVFSPKILETCTCLLLMLIH